MGKEKEEQGGRGGVEEEEKEMKAMVFYVKVEKRTNRHQISQSFLLSNTETNVSL